MKRALGLVAAGLVGVLAATLASVPASADASPSKAAAGTVFSRGDSLTAANGVKFVYQGDGNVVSYFRSKPIWSTATGGKSSSRLVLQGDGRLVLYAGSKAIWNTGASGANPRMVAQSDGNVVIYSGSKAIWSVKGDIAARAAAQKAAAAEKAKKAKKKVTDRLSVGQSLAVGQYLKSANGRYRLVLQSDSNLVVYDRNSSVWSSGTSGTKASRLVQQSDGNVVLLGASGAIWSTGTKGSGAKLIMTNAGRAVVSIAGTTRWSAPTPKPTAPAVVVLPNQCTNIHLVICVSKTDRKVRYVMDGKIIREGDARFGDARGPGYATHEGSFSVFAKYAMWHSTIYNNAAMPFSMFFYGGEAIHYSSDFASDGYWGASHGCVNLRDYAFAEWLFGNTPYGTRVFVYR